ncbi:MAG: fumarate hydratase, partial [Clostridiales bacterium]|nr:fumarate hydratase [Clostridiales bacterium]
DPYTPLLLERGLLVMIGKGKRSAAVKDAMKEYGAVYLGATGGAAALISRCITSCETVAWEDLGAEAVHRYEVSGFPALVLADSLGNDLYETGPEAFRE